MSCNINQSEQASSPESCHQGTTLTLSIFDQSMPCILLGILPSYRGDVKSMGMISVRNMALNASNCAIAALCGRCSRAFHQLCSALRSTPEDLSYYDQVPESAVQDELGRFRVWLGNVGAHRHGRISLDYRLREAAHMRESVLEFLKELEANLTESRLCF